MVRLICACTANTYFLWQVETMLFNFKHMGIDFSYLDLVCSKPNGVIPNDWLKLANRYGARLFFYNDERTSRKFGMSIRNNLLKQHFKKYPTLEKETIFYHDCDIIFSKPINFSQFEGNNIWYGSGAKQHISSDYILSRGEDVLKTMTENVNIDSNLVVNNLENTIGFQLILKNINYKYWEGVERDSEIIYKTIVNINSTKTKEDSNFKKLDEWCSDMYALLWNGWKLGHVTQPHDSLMFCFASANENAYHNCPIMHNTNINYENKEGLFNKSDYQNSLPYNLNLKIKDNTASKKYYEWVQRVEKNSVLISHTHAFI